jgi:hypothetical protein
LVFYAGNVLLFEDQSNVRIQNRRKKSGRKIMAKRRGRDKMRIARTFVLTLIVLCLLCFCFSGPVAGKKPVPDPTEPPTPEPTEEPTEIPTPEPTEEPTDTPTPEPTEEPTDTPTPEPTEVPEETPTPTLSPGPDVTPEETPDPTLAPNPTLPPTWVPSSDGSSGGGGGGVSGNTAFIPTRVPALPTDWYSCDITSAVLSSSEGGQRITLDLGAAGEEIELSGNHITFRNRGLQISIETEEPLNSSDAIINATVRKATIKTDPIIGEIREKGTKFLGMVEATYTEAPPASSRIKVTLGVGPTDDQLKRFREGAKTNGIEIRDIAHTMQVQTQNLSPPASAMIVISVSPEWVTTHGRNTIRIMRVADDGTAEILETKTAGYDQFGNIIYAADSPNGFSTFGLISVLQVSSSDPVTTSPVPVSSIGTQPPTTTLSLPLMGSSSASLPLPWFIAPALVIVLIGEGFAHLYLIERVRREK